MSKKLDNLDDGELVRAIRSGTCDACGVLVDRYLSSVYAIALRICGNSADAEDISQDTFVRAFDRLDQYHPEFSFRNWLLKIATNLAISHLRSLRREQQVKRQAAIEGWSRANRRKAERGEDAEEWQKWLNRLEVSQRAAIVLFHFQELSYAEVAQAMEVPVNTVRTLIHRGRQHLRELMADEHIEAETTHEVR